MRILCWLGFHDMAYGPDDSRVRNVRQDERHCVRCDRIEFWADGQWVNYLRFMRPVHPLLWGVLPSRR